jgi:hypothetical protein
MKAMNWILGAVAAAALLAPLQSANAWGGDPDGGGDPYQSYHVHDRGDGYYGGYRGYHRPHRHYYRPHRHYHRPHRHYHRPHRYYRPYGDYRGHRPDYREYGYYGRPGYGYRGPVVAPPPPPFPW